jgi:superfamily II DNA or RNA helicase
MELPPLTEIQKEAIRFIYNSWDVEEAQNSLCVVGVGLGKTRIACEIMNSLINSNDIRLEGYTLVCCLTTSTRDTIWYDTLSQYGIKTIVLSGSGFENVKMPIKKCLTIPPKTVCLITYANLIRTERDGTLIIDYFKNTPPHFIVFDEFHTLSNSFTREEQQYRKAILALPFQLRLGLTATPLVNAEDEMVLAYGLLNNPKLCKIFMENKEKGTPQELIQYIKERKFFYHKHIPYSETHYSDWLISIPMNKDFYDKYKELRSIHQKNGQVNQQNEILRFLVEGTYKKGKEQIICQSDTGKMLALRCIIEHINQDDKVLIFDNYIHTLDYIYKQEWIRPFNPVLHHGKKSDNHNKESYKRFTEDKECRIFLTTRSQCSEGINLQIANHVIIMNCWWTAKDLIQMIGRIKRKGQTKPVYSYLLGYNLISLVNKKESQKQDYFLPEELSQYQTIGKKVFINELWGMDVKEQLPKVMLFDNDLTFVQNFNRWLEGIIIPDVPRLDSDDEKCKKEKDALEKERLIQEKIKQRKSKNMINALLAYMLMQNSKEPLINPEEEFEDPCDKPGYFAPIPGLEDIDI